jgi:hypothetical protein
MEKSLRANKKITLTELNFVREQDETKGQLLIVRYHRTHWQLTTEYWQLDFSYARAFRRYRRH